MCIHHKFALAAGLVLSMSAGAAKAACDPVDFFIKDITSVQITDEQKIAFLQIASSSQYDAATKTLGVPMAFGPIAGTLSYDQAQKSARQEASLRRMTYDRNYNGNVLIKAVSPEAAKQYAACLEHDQATVGLRLSLVGVVGPYAYVQGKWVGQDAGQGKAKLDPGSVYRHAQKIRTPQVWLKGVSQTFPVERDPAADGLVSIAVGGLEGSVVIPRDAVETPMGTATVAGKPIGASSGGSHDGNSEWVQPHSEAACITPQRPGGYLVVGSGNVTDVKRVGDASRATWRVVTDTPQQICVEVGSSTPAKKQVNSIKVVPTATERYPLELQRTAGG